MGKMWRQGKFQFLDMTTAPQFVCVSTPLNTT